MQLVAGERFELGLFWTRDGLSGAECTVVAGQAELDVEAADLEGARPGRTDREREAVGRVQAAVQTAAQEELRDAALSPAERLAAEAALAKGGLPNHAAMRARLAARVRQALGSREQPIEVQTQRVGGTWSVQAPPAGQGRRTVLRLVLVAVTDCEVTIDALRVGRALR